MQKIHALIVTIVGIVTIAIAVENVGIVECSGQLLLIGTKYHTYQQLSQLIHILQFFLGRQIIIK